MKGKSGKMGTQAVEKAKDEEWSSVGLRLCSDSGIFSELQNMSVSGAELHDFDSLL